MKRSGLIAAAVLIISSCVSQPTPPAEVPVQEPVQAQVQEPAAETPVVAVVKEPVRKERIEEFKTPVPVKETITFADGVVDRVVTMVYDKDNRLLISTSSKKPSTPDPIERVTYEYQEGLLSVKSVYGSDGSLQSKSQYVYQKPGELIKETILDGKSLVQSISEWTWDNGHKSTWQIISAAGVVLAKTEYVYEGDVLKAATLYDGAGNSKGSIEYSYGEGDMLTAVKYFNAAGSQDGRVEYVVKDGRVMQESTYRYDGRLERRMSYEYGQDGALLRKTLADSSGKAREVSVFENVYRTDTRVIVYYE
jgi:hypothetical protein